MLEFSAKESVKTQTKFDNNKENVTKETNSIDDTIDYEEGSKLLANVKRNDSYKVIPFFYHKLPKSKDTIAQKLRDEA